IVIASNIAAIPEVVKDGVSGYLFEPNNHFDLADKINYVINSCDYLRMKDKSRQYAINNFSWEKMAKDTKSTYENVLTYMKSSI
nr:glycosyltransferase [Bacteroidota bacterium]